MRALQRLFPDYAVLFLFLNLSIGTFVSNAQERNEGLIITEQINRFTIEKDNQPVTDDFIYTDSLGTIRLEPGHYILKTFNTPDKRAQGRPILEFVVTESLWQTGTGTAILSLCAVLIVFLSFLCVILRIRNLRTKRKSKDLLDRKEKIIRNQNDLLHELKTPMSLIYNPIRDVIDLKKLSEKEQETLENALKQAKKISDILLEHEKYTLESYNKESVSDSDNTETIETYPIEQETEDDSVNDIKPFSTSNASILFVDDDTDLLDYILMDYKDLFRNIYTSNNGVKALELARDKMPDVIICDIMMPQMNGFDLCRTIKSDLELSHIPVILLTSRSNLQNQETGYKMGADAFVAKPFDSKTMYKMISNLLKNRWDLKKQYSDSAFTTLSKEQTYSFADEQFILKLNRLISENLSNTELDSTFLARQLEITRTALFNKMSNLLGTSAKRYIRKIRIEYAKNLLANSEKSIGEIADLTGFSLSHYFSTIFKQETGMTPRQYKDKYKTRA